MVRMEKRIVEVLVPVALDHTYSYRVPDDLELGPGDLVGVPLGAVPNDLPLNLVQPARLETLAPFPFRDDFVAEGQSSPDGLLVDATLDAQGQVMTYRILSGPSNAAAQRQLDQVLLFSRFRPLVSFGLPLSGGHVVLSFNQVRVRG